MRKPYVDYNADETIVDFIQLSAGHGSQETMIGCEILFAAGLASRDVLVTKYELTLQFTATPALASRLQLLKNATKDTKDKNTKNEHLL